jgi:hypothetical protein
MGLGNFGIEGIEEIRSRLKHKPIPGVETCAVRQIDLPGLGPPEISPNRESELMEKPRIRNVHGSRPTLGKAGLPRIECRQSSPASLPCSSEPGDSQ